MFAKYTLNYVLFDEISLLLLPYIPIPVFLTAVTVLLCYTSSSIFSRPFTQQ